MPRVSMAMGVGDYLPRPCRMWRSRRHRAEATNLAHPDGGAEMPSTGDDRPTGLRFNPLSPDEARVILGEETERPFTGEYTDLKDPGTFICRHPKGQSYRP